MHFDISVVGIGFAGQQSFELAARDFGLKLLEGLFTLADGFLILLGLAELDHGQLVVELLLDPAY